MNPSTPVTIRDLARYAGVSIGTVSRALKHAPGLAESTRQMVLAAAQTLGYDCNKLRHKRARRVAFVLHRQHHTAAGCLFYGPVLQGAEHACRRHGLAFSFMAVGSAGEVEQQLQLHEPDAIVCAGHLAPAIVSALGGSSRPLVLIDTKLCGYSSVNPDNVMGAYLVTKHLLGLGRSRIAMVSGSFAHYSIRGRNEGYRQALFEAGVLADPRYEVNLPDDIGLETAVPDAMRSLLALPRPPDAVFCFNDSTALAAMHACVDAGLKVPQDISIAGFDDIASAVLGHLPLTTLRVDKKQLGTQAVELLLADKPSAPVDRVSPVELIIRASTFQPCVAGASRLVS